MKYPVYKIVGQYNKQPMESKSAAVIFSDDGVCMYSKLLECYDDSVTISWLLLLHLVPLRASLARRHCWKVQPQLNNDT